MIMAQFHHVVFYDTASELWFLDLETDAYFPDGEVFDYAGTQEWSPIPESEASGYLAQMKLIVSALNGPGNSHN
jgi:hypothetical protein